MLRDLPARRVSGADPWRRRRRRAGLNRSSAFKCPPAPSETALLMHDFLTGRGLRDRSEIALVMPLPVPIPPSPDASKAILEAFAARGIEWHASHLVRELDPARKVARFDDGSEMPFDLFLGVPVHAVPAVVAESGMCVDGWIAVDPVTLATRWPGVYAVGDVTSVGTPKAGVFAEGQAAVVAEEIIAGVRGGAPAGYDGRGICYLEFGARGSRSSTSHSSPARHRSASSTDRPPSSPPPSRRSAPRRVKRWFDRDW